MTGESSSKQLKAEEKDDGREGIDWMSSLPDSVLLYILSFLPTKTSVRIMSLVSRRWRYLWKDLQVFRFSDISGDPKLFKWFALFMNGVHTFRRSRDIRKMHLYCYTSGNEPFLADSIDTWIGAAMGPRLEELSLRFVETRSCGIVNIPPTPFFNCTNLVSLSLSGSIKLNVQHSSALVHFPSLKELFLQVDHLDSINALLSGCPVLETLNIIDVDDSYKFCVPPSLKRLKYDNDGIKIYFEIDAPRLQYLSITTEGKFDAAVGNLHNVVEAYIDVFSPNKSESVNPLLNLLRALSGTKHLTLCSSATEPLLCDPIIDFPEFCYLLHLNLELSCCFNSNLLVNVLDKCHVLQDLIIENNKLELPFQTWEPQSTRVPNCLVSHLTSIHIKGYCGFEDELAFAEYVLRNGLVLKTMFIITDLGLDIEERHCILKRLSDIPRGSVMCQLKFD